jgi:hypothetical protein
MKYKDNKKEPLFCRLLGHKWQRCKELDKDYREHASKCARCGKVSYIKLM